MNNYGSYFNNLEDAIWGERSRIYADRACKMRQAKIRRPVMRRLARLDTYATRAARQEGAE